ncbi:MAG TPA: hypothetical protein VMN78_13410 [Longimicrobiales bacterium]|nr:hypothetical protein [Longimicrobiales bacterium]
MWKGTKTRRGLAAFMLTTAVVLGGCDDDPITGGDEEPDVGGFAMTSGSTELYRYTDEDAAQPDTLFLTSGQTYEVEVEWLDPNGDPIELGEEFELRVQALHPGIASFTVTGAATGTIVAASVSSPVSTAMQVTLWHTVEEHPDFDSVFFPVKVSP